MSNCVDSEWFNNFEEKEFNLFTDECYPHQYDEVGVTNFCSETNGDNKFAVYIDMHS